MSWKCQMCWNFKCLEVSNVMKCQMSWNVKCHEMSNVMRCSMSWNVKCHEMLMLMMDLWPKQKHQALHTSERIIVPWTVICAPGRFIWWIVDLLLSGLISTKSVWQQFFSYHICNLAPGLQQTYHKQMMALNIVTCLRLLKIVVWV